MLPLIHYLLQVSFITNSPKYANVRCSHRALRRLSAVAKHMAKNEAAKYFAGRFIGLVFSKAELAAAEGLGLRGGEGLDQTKVDAVFG